MRYCCYYHHYHHYYYYHSFGCCWSVFLFYFLESLDTKETLANFGIWLVAAVWRCSSDCSRCFSSSLMFPILLLFPSSLFISLSSNLPITHRCHPPIVVIPVNINITRPFHFSPNLFKNLSLAFLSLSFPLSLSLSLSLEMVSKSL